MDVLKKIIVAGMAFCIPVSAVLAESAKTLPEVVSHTVLNNPEVSAGWYTFKAATAEKRAAQGGYLPSVDLSAQVGREQTDTPTTADNSYSTDSVRLTLTQMLFDGFSVRNNVKRLDAASLARFYELRQVSEEKAQEAAQAYIDVMRYQQLVELAKQNYVQHKLLFDDIEERTNAGISRRVDLDQARGRLALAETNLLTELDNLHDVKVRYQRIVGMLPPTDPEWPEFPGDILPAKKAQALRVAYALSPAINSAIESLNSAQAEAKTKNAAMMPRFDLRLRQELEHDRDGTDGQFDEQAVELVMTYNLYKGGSHSAEKRQFHEQANAAREQRVRVCQEVRQTVAIAYNNTTSLQEQLEYQRINREATRKARDAYREQFDIGQRTLLDLLDQENEYFQVSRSVVNAEADFVVAQVTTLAGMGQLLEALQVVGYEGIASDGLDLNRKVDEELYGRCPAEAPDQLKIDKPALLEAVMRGEDTSALQTASFIEPVSQAPAQVSVVDYATGRPVAMVEFDFGSAFVKPAYDESLQSAAEFMRQNPQNNMLLEGHTDQVGEDAINMSLSQQRAEAVKEKLIDRHGVDQTRLRAEGRGKKMIIPGASDAQNRRVELVAVEPDASQEPLKF